MSRAPSLSNFIQACKNGNYKKSELIFRTCNQQERTKIAKAIVDQVNKRTTLHYFARFGNVEAINACLSLGIDKNVRDVNGWTSLLTSIAFRRFDIAAALITSGANVNIPEKNGVTPIAFAAEIGHLPTIDLLIEAGADPNICGSEGSYPIIRAVNENQYAAVKKLIDAGANLDVVDLDEGTALITAISTKRNEIAKLLIDSGANLDIKNREGITALLSAIHLNNAEMVSILVEAGANVNLKVGEGVYPLAYAVGNGYEEISIILLNSGAKMNRNPRNDHYPPAANVAGVGNVAMIDILLAFRVDFSCRSNVFDALIVASKEGKYEVVETLLAMRDVYPMKYPDDGTKTCFPALHSAAIPGYIDILKLLLASGEDKNVKNMFHMTPYNCAEQNGQQEAMDLLMDDSYPSLEDKEKVQQRFVEIRNRIQQLRETIVNHV